MDYIITKERILIAEVVEYFHFDGRNLTQKPMTDRFRKVAFIDGHIIDFQTGSEIFKLERDYNGYIECDVDADTLYYLELYKCTEVTDNDLLYATQIYEIFTKQQELIKAKKLIPFPKRNLYKYKRR